MSCDSSQESIDFAEKGEESLKKWNKLGPQSYVYELEYTGFSANQDQLVTVHCGVPDRETDQTIPELIQDIIDYDGACEVRVAFNGEFGFPLDRENYCGVETDGYKLRGFKRLEIDTCLE